METILTFSLPKGRPCFDSPIPVIREGERERVRVRDRERDRERKKRKGKKEI